MSSAQSQIRVRFAPSPTGYLHVGGARTALYNFLYARNQGGTFVLRIEDTDQARSTDEALRMQIEDLQWLGLTWDEGPDPVTLKDVGNFGPYRQSQRLDIYKKHAEQLINEGKAYYCFLTDAEIEKQREELMKAGKQPHIESPYADWTLEQAKAKLSTDADKAVVRFKTKHLRKDYVFTDLVRGEVRFPSDMVGDFVMLRSGGMPVYNFCNVIDDHLMEMTHVLRAEEHLPNTLRQLMLYEAYGWKAPQFGHLSIILDEERKKLSKRKGATSCHEFKMEGYLPEGLNNFLSLLGWSHPEGKEVFGLDELIQKFSLDKFHSSGAVFDAVKLKWVNATHLRALPALDIWQLLQPFFARENFAFPSNPDWQVRSVEIFKPYMETLADAIELYRPLSDHSFVLHPEAAEVAPWPQTKPVLVAWKDLLEKETSDYINEARFLELQELVKNNAGAKGKNLFQPLRVAIIGKPHGAELKILVPLLKRSTLIQRAQHCIEKL
jgi:nondiscriminating glutamyl-tRNA synthetase